MAHDIAVQFVLTYYQLFDTNREGLRSLYVAESKLDFEGQSMSGQDAIMAKIMGLPFKSVQHQITTKDVSMTVDGGLLILVVGQLKTDQDPVLPFVQSFYLKQTGDSLFVMNDTFRLMLHHQ